MTFQFPLCQCPSLDTLYCQALRLTFSDTLENVQKSVYPIVNDLKDKQLIKCYLIPTPILPKPKYQAVLLGGTFDYFHLGHQFLLLTAILAAQKRILVGVTGQKLLSKKKNKQLIQSIGVRMKEVEHYIKMIKPQLIVEVQQINDPFGPAIHRGDFDAIAVSIETIQGANKINEIRKQKNLGQLKILICPLMSESNKIEAKISSSDIREHVLQKNKLSIQNLMEYKAKWKELNKRIADYLQINRCQIHKNQWWNRILTQYSEYWRHYHTNQHIYSLLKELQKEENISKLKEDEFLVVAIGIWFHDIQYIPSSKQNEQVSADIAEEYLKGWMKNSTNKLQDLIKRCKTAIMATKTHQGSSLEQKILIDLDMSILDSQHKDYAEYAENIRREYQPLVKQKYNEKRGDFLKNLKVQEVFYLRKPIHLVDNLGWEQKMLAKQKQQL